MFTRRLLVVLLLISANELFSQTKSNELDSIRVSYGGKGFQFQTADDRFELRLQSRFQFRFVSPYDRSPATFEDLNKDPVNTFNIRRARLKVGGHAFKPWLKYYWEYELSSSFILDYRIMIEKWKGLNFKVGQWKLEYSRDRRISSGKQQLVDRALTNRQFTVDRQQGVEVYGHLEGNKALNFNYWLAVLTGTGIGGRINDDENLMYFGRLQWNFLGRALGFVGSDLERREKPEAIIAVAGVTNISPYTRFSSGGGGYLEGYNKADSGSFQMNQANIETAFLYKGFSWQSEFHLKEIIDQNDIVSYNLMHGYYVQAGYFFHGLFDWWPKELELAARRAYYEPQKDLAITREETSVAVNWFFNGHRNKLTSELSYFEFEEGTTDDSWRVRVQWDISF